MKKVIIFGIGAIGSNLAVNISKDLPDVEMTVVDFDKVEARNFIAGTQAYTRNDLNRYKVHALQNHIYYHSNKKIATMNKKIESLEDINEIINSVYNENDNLVIINCIDDIKTRNFFLDISSKYNIFNLGFSKSFSGTAIWNDINIQQEKATESSKNEDFDICTMEGSKSFIMAFTAISTVVLIDFFNRKIKNNIYFDKNFILRKIK